MKRRVYFGCTPPECGLKILLPVIDFVYADQWNWNQNRYLREVEKPAWVRITSASDVKDLIGPIDRILIDSLTAYKACVSILPDTTIIHGIWTGGLAQHLWLKEINPRTFYHYQKRAGRTIPKHSWLYGMRNMDELARVKPDVLITNLPFIAAIAGADLSQRERRLKSVGESYPLEVHFTLEELNTIKATIQTIKEVCSGE